MDNIRKIIWAWARAAVAVGVPFGLASALLAWALHESLGAEEALTTAGAYDAAGPSLLLLLLYGIGGHVSGTIADGWLGIERILAMAVVAASGAIALAVGAGAYALLAGSVPSYLLCVEIVGALTWLAVGGRRVYVD